MPIHDWTLLPGAIFHSFHGSWIHEIADALNDGVLPPGYYALGERRIAGMEPDVLAFHRSGARPAPAPPAAGGAALSLATRPPAVSTVERADGWDEEPLETSAVVRTADGDAVVAVIEVASPGNKDSRPKLDAFLGKGVGLIGAGVHLLLIDLHPPGPLDPRGLHAALWGRLTGRPAGEPAGDGGGPLTQASYLAGDPPRAFVEPARCGAACSTRRSGT